MTNLDIAFDAAMYNIMLKRLDRLSDLIRCHPEVVAHRDAEGDTLLVASVSLRVAPAARLLIETGSNCNAVDTLGRTLLQLLAQHEDDDCETASLLVSGGTKIDAIGYMGWTALHMAAAHGRNRLISYLISAGASLDIADEEVMHTPLRVALESQNYVSALILGRAGASMDVRDSVGIAPRGVISELCPNVEPLLALKLLAGQQEQKGSVRAFEHQSTWTQESRKAGRDSQ